MNETDNAVEKKKNPPMLILIAVIIAVVVGIVVFFVSYANSPEKKLLKQLELGHRYLTEEDYERAIAAFDVALSIDPKNVDAFLGKAGAYVGLGNYDEAINIYAQGYSETNDEKIKQELEKVVREQADSLVNNGDTDKAIDVMNGIQEQIAAPLFEEYISSLQNEGKAQISDEESAVDEEIKVVPEDNEAGSNIVMLTGADVYPLAADESLGDFDDERFPSSLAIGGFDIHEIYGDYSSREMYVICGRDIIDSVGLTYIGVRGYYMDITFTYSYTEEYTDSFGHKSTIYYDADIVDLYYYESPSTPKELIKDGVIIGSIYHYY